jgi:hypothetical protein
MMKANLEFNLPDDQHEHLVAVHATDLYMSLWDLDQWLRGKIKYPEENKFKSKMDVLEKTREQLREIMENRGVNLEMMP